MLQFLNTENLSLTQLIINDLKFCAYICMFTVRYIEIQVYEVHVDTLVETYHSEGSKL